MDGSGVAIKTLAFRQIAQRLVAGRPLLKEPQDPLWGGLSVQAWLTLFAATHSVRGMGGAFGRDLLIEGPSAADEPAIACAAFMQIKSVLESAADRENVHGAPA